MNIERQDWWFLIGDKFFFWDSYKGESYINLLKNIWEDISYWKPINSNIEYPWEYDIQWVYIKSIQGENYLNYYVKTDETSFAIVDTNLVFDDENFASAELYFYDPEDIDLPSELWKMEISTDIVALS